LLHFTGVGVIFFFLLSGYILSMVYLRDDEVVTPRKFWTARLARIYPLYFLTIFVAAIYSFLTRFPRLGFRRELVGVGALFLEHVFLLQHWFPQLVSLNFPTWSVSTEAFYYLLFPWIGVALGHRSTRTSLAIALVVCLSIEALIWRGIDGPDCHFKPVLELRYFVAGIVIAKCHVSLMHWQEGNRWLIHYGALLCLVCLCALLVMFEFHDALGLDRFPDPIEIVTCSVLILSCASGNRWVTRVFAPSWLVILGESSYGLYLLHVPVYVYTMGRLGPHPGHLAFTLYVVGTTALSVVSFYFFETPSRRFVLRFFSTRTRESIAEASIAQ